MMNAEFIAEFYKGISKPLPCLSFKPKDSSVPTTTFYDIIQVEAGGPFTLCLTDIEMSKYFIDTEQFTIIGVLSDVTYERLQNAENEEPVKVAEEYDE